MSFGGAVLLRRQRQTLHIAEKANSILDGMSMTAAGELHSNLPKRDPKPPDSFHLVARRLVGADPVAVHYVAVALVLDVALEL